MKGAWARVLVGKDKTRAALQEAKLKAGAGEQDMIPSPMVDAIENERARPQSCVAKSKYEISRHASCVETFSSPV